MRRNTKRINEGYREKRDHAIDTIEYYDWLTSEGHCLSDEQRQQLIDVINFLVETDAADNPVTGDWIKFGKAVLKRNANKWEGGCQKQDTLESRNKKMNKKTIRLTESDLHRVIKESVAKILKEANEGADDKFSLAMHKLYSLLKDEIGGDSMRDTIASWFWQDWDGETKIVPCKYDETGMFYLTYDLCNYDAICLNDDGTVNVGYSNVPQIAKLIKPFVSKENGMRIVHNLYGR